MKKSKWGSYIMMMCGMLVLVGCKNVEPWERGNLAKPQMALDPNPMQSTLSTHIYTSREAASGGDAAEGGGCGCN